ncbi:hypothetical protein FRD01_15030 [Microvenator marinus]|uniref:Uncharacterized protein n=1 Tax=Microvenator marinus TaxID=2600177 RepID=A0A5B8XTB3_9DELT|nr:hypothetical protein [Microvenator marinus]QED28521.1 hypothetical protein FRD01_15030 [Microvenator marinus]
MKVTNALVLLLFALPLHATAQGRLHSPDPEPMTYGCQSHHAGFLPGGDIVMVDYHGAWKTWEAGNYSQNGGFENGPCEVRRIFRMSLDGQLKWELGHSEDGLGRGDLVTGIATFPDGKVAVGLTEEQPLQDQKARVLLLDENGQVVWMKTSANKSKFAQATPHADESGNLYVEYHASNFGYKGGYFSTEGSKIYPIKPNHEVQISARMDLDDGKIIWERKGLVLVANKDGLLTFEMNQSGRKVKNKIEIIKSNGKLKNKPLNFRTTGEFVTSAQPFGEHVVVTLVKENKTSENAKGVSFRDGRIMVFNKRGKLVHNRKISDGAKLAQTQPGAPLRVLSPVDCERGLVGGYSCHTSAIQVLTFDSIEDIEKGGKATILKEPGHAFHYEYFSGLSTKDGLYFSAETFTGNSPKEAGPGVLAGFSSDEERARVTAKVHVWKPIKVKPPELKLGF